MTIKLYVLSTQGDQLAEILKNMAEKGRFFEHWYTDINEDAQADLAKYNFTVLPVLFKTDDSDNSKATKLAEGDDILNLSAEQIV